MQPNRKPRRGSAQAPHLGLSLIEVLITLAIISILAGALLPHLQADIPDRLTAVGQILASDLEYARSLAVSNNSKYRCEFEVSENRYHLEHSGTAPVLAALPPNPFRASDDEVDEQFTRLEDLPIGHPTVELIAVLRMSGAGVPTNNVEFAPHGGTTRAEATIIWLGCGYGEGRRFLPVAINATTGLVEIGEVTARLPSGVSDVAAASRSGVQSPWGAIALARLPLPGAAR